MVNALTSTLFRCNQLFRMIRVFSEAGIGIIAALCRAAIRPTICMSLNSGALQSYRMSNGDFRFGRMAFLTMRGDRKLRTELSTATSAQALVIPATSRRHKARNKCHRTLLCHRTIHRTTAIRTKDFQILATCLNLQAMVFRFRRRIRTNPGTTAAIPSRHRSITAATPSSSTGQNDSNTQLSVDRRMAADAGAEEPADSCNWTLIGL